MPALTKSQKRTVGALLDRGIPESCRYRRGSCATYRDVVDAVISAGASCVYLSGGIVRDLVSGHLTKDLDLDIKFYGSVGKGLVDVFGKMRLASRVDFNPKYTYFFVGCDPDENMEGFHTSLESVECPANSLRIKLPEMTMEDPTGVGVADAKGRVWRIPPGHDRDAWIDRSAGLRLVWRMLKFRLRGFSVPPGDVSFVYRKAKELVAGSRYTAADVRNMASQVSPVDGMLMMVSDAAAGAAEPHEVSAIASRVLRSGLVWRPLPRSRLLPPRVAAPDRSGEWAYPTPPPDPGELLPDMLTHRARGFRVSTDVVSAVYRETAALLSERPSDVSYLSIGTDPMVAVEILVEDACRDPTGDARAALSHALAGGLLAPVPVVGNIPFQQTCSQRDAVIANNRVNRPAKKSRGAVR